MDKAFYFALSALVSLAIMYAICVFIAGNDNYPEWGWGWKLLAVIVWASMLNSLVNHFDKK